MIACRTTGANDHQANCEAPIADSSQWLSGVFCVPEQRKMKKFLEVGCFIDFVGDSRCASVSRRVYKIIAKISGGYMHGGDPLLKVN